MSEFRKLVERIFAEHNIKLDEDFPTMLDLNPITREDPIPHKFPAFNLDEEKIYDKDSGYNVSDDEEYYWDLIKKKWPNAEKSVTLDFFRNPENHRPWQIDAYIPSEKMMIQFNGHIKHGRRPYNPEDPNCQADVEWLKSMPGDFYDKILYTWTELEPLKRKIAAENGYRYIEIFNPDEFNKWYANPELNYEEYKYPLPTMQYDRDEYFKQKERGTDIFGNSSNPHYHNVDEATIEEANEFNIGDIAVSKQNGKVYRVVDTKYVGSRQMLLIEYPVAEPLSYIDVNGDRVDTVKINYQKTKIPSDYLTKGTKDDFEKAVELAKQD